MIILLAAHCLLRPGEGPQIRLSELNLNVRCLSRVLGLVSLLKPKTRNRAARVQHVTIENAELLNHLLHFVTVCDFGPTDFLFPTYRELSMLIRRWLDYLVGPGHPFTLHGLRGGAATLWYLETGNVSELLRRGRWASEKSLNTYLQLQAGLSASFQIPPDRLAMIESLAGPWEHLLRPR